MIDPWRHIDADDDLVADFVAGTVELLLENGGWLHPQARIVARSGQLRLVCDAPEGEPLVRVPAAAFVRIGRVTWSASADALEMVDVPDDIDGLERELLILQTALHNACGKVPWLASSHPVLAPDLPDDVIDAVRVFRPSFRRRQPTPASLLWSTRVFRLPTPGSAAPEPVAVPVVDLLDHRSSGATGTWTGEAFAVDVSHAGAAPGVWLDYGLKRDAIGMAVVYGFADDGNPRAHSAPVSVEVPGIGAVQVLAKGRTRSGDLLPPVATRTPEGATISHLTFAQESTGLVVQDLAGGSGWSPEEAHSVVRSIAQANLGLCGGLLSRAAEVDGDAAAVLAQAARRQAHLLMPHTG